MAAKRHKYGSGTVYKRKDGRWCAIFPYPRGSNQRKWVYGTTRREAEVAMKAVLAAPYVEPVQPAAPQWTVGTWLSYWLENIYRPSVDLTTYEKAAAVVKHHLLPGLADIALVALSPMDVQRLITARIAEKYAPSTIAFILNKLNVALNKAVKMELLDKNPAKDATKPRIEQSERVILSEAQARKLLQVAQAQEMGLIVIVGVYTGMRAGELYALHWEDIDFGSGEVRVERGIVWTKAQGKRENAPKTKEGRRTLFLAPVVLAMLAAHREAQAVERAGKAEDWNTGNYVFPNRKGKPRANNETWYYWKRLLNAADLPDMRFHDLRHSFTSFLAHLRVPEKAVQEMLGHAAGSPITREVYTHSLPGVGQEAMRRLSELLNTPDEK